MQNISLPFLIAKNPEGVEKPSKTKAEKENRFKLVH